jgi:hypothetical protein
MKIDNKIIAIKVTFSVPSPNLREQGFILLDMSQGAKNRE